MLDFQITAQQRPNLSIIIHCYILGESVNKSFGEEVEL